MCDITSIHLTTLCLAVCTVYWPSFLKCLMDGSTRLILTTTVLADEIVYLRNLVETGRVSGDSLGKRLTIQTRSFSVSGAIT